jgi:hypothetical protein
MRKPWTDFAYGKTEHDGTFDKWVRSCKSFDMINGTPSTLPSSDLSIKTKKSLQSMRSIINLSQKLSVRSLRHRPSEDASNCPWQLSSQLAFPITTPLRRNQSVSDTSTVDSGYFDSCGIPRRVSTFSSVSEKDDTLCQFIISSNNQCRPAMDQEDEPPTPYPTGVLSSCTDSLIDLEGSGTLSSAIDRSKLPRLFDPQPSVEDILLTMPFVQKYKATYLTRQPIQIEQCINVQLKGDLAKQVRQILGSAVSEADEDWETEAQNHEQDYQHILIPSITL